VIGDLRLVIFETRNSPPPARRVSIFEFRFSLVLGAERTSAAAGGFHIRVVELKTCTLQGLYVVDLGAAMYINDAWSTNTFRPSNS
jgi:hypothetical protein